MSNVVPGRPRRQQQVYRRANTSGNLITGSGLDNGNLEDPYVGCSSIVDKFINSAASSGYESSTLPVGSVMNGSASVGSSRKSSSSGGGALKDFLMGRNNTSKDLTYPSSNASGMSDITVTADSLPTYSGSNRTNNWALQDQSVINDLTIGPPRQQPKYSYLVGRSNTSKDLWKRPALNTSFSNVNSFQPSAPMVPHPPPPLPTSSLPLQSSQSTSYVGGPPSSSRYGTNAYIPKRSSQLYENYDYQGSNSMYGDNVSSFGSTTGTTAAGSKRNINTSIGTDYQIPQTTPSHHSHMYNQPPPQSYTKNNDLINVSNTNSNIPNSSASAALSYEERINTALGRKVPKSSTSSTIASTQNVQQSKSFSNFQAVQVPILVA
jgi:hypothetical protein